ncbi:MATE family efflux transporter [Albibacterium indicum]|uniref:MATE family efflux transporter n=1 Tax=Albibacterium indicum TaxID=2292082 RepID=UPI000E51359B|nr:MATE family efflux transporter [Pedobacter indicus]
MKNHLAIAKKAFPIILANASVPLLGLVDTAAIGHTGGAQEIGAIALGALVFSFLYWGFGFLRMGTTGYVSQAFGAGKHDEIRNIGLRYAVIALGIGILFICLQQLILPVALHLLDTSVSIKQLVGDYFYVRIWGAPATLCTYALLGILIGLGETKKLLVLQLVLNGLNIILNVIFVVFLGFGVKGIALGTVLAEWTSLFFGIWMVWQILNRLSPTLQNIHWKTLFNRQEFGQMMQTNGNIMIRTLALLFGFAWFTNRGAGFGDGILAANHILLQFVSLSAFFLDGYAYVVEMMVGRNLGARDERAFQTELKLANELAGATALVLALLFFFGGNLAINGLTTDVTVRGFAYSYLPLACLYIFTSFYAFQLDGVFIGATLSKEMRNASIVSVIVFLASSLLLSHYLGNKGLWIAFIIYVSVRGISLHYYMPRVRKLFHSQ